MDGLWLVAQLNFLSAGKELFHFLAGARGLAV
jgi:hypothetical protein